MIPDAIKIKARDRRVCRVSYATLIRRVRYARTSQGSDPVEFAPTDHILDPRSPQDAKHFHNMYNFYMNHYGSFLDTLKDKDQEMLTFSRRVPFNLMNRYLNKGNTLALLRLINPYRSTHPTTIEAMSPEDRRKIGEHVDTLNRNKKEIQHGVDTMNEIIDRSPPMPHDLIVYRGLRTIAPARAPGPGEILHATGFSSTSLNPNISRNFSAENAVMRIHVPAGTQMAPVTPYQVREKGLGPDDPHFKAMEQELALGPGHGFQVTHPIEYVPGLNLHVLNTRLLPQGPRPAGAHAFP